MTESLLASILGLDLTDFLLHLLNFLILVGGIGLLVYKPVIRFVHARREEVEKQENEHNAKMQEAESTKVKYTALIGTAEQEIAEKKKEMEKQTAVAAEKTLTDARVRAEKIGNVLHEGRGRGSRRTHRFRNSQKRDFQRRKRPTYRQLSERMGERR